MRYQRFGFEECRLRDRVDVIVLLQNLAGGGAERVLLTLASTLAGTGMAVKLVLVRAEGPYLDDVPPGLQPTVLGPQRTRQVLPALVHRLRLQRSRWLITGLTHVNLVGIAARRIARSGTRILVTEHNRITSDQPVPGGHWARRLMPFVYPLADEIVAVSKGVGQDLIRTARLPSARVRVVHNPVDCRRIAKLALEVAPHPWLVDGGPPVVLGIGRLLPQKDFPTLLRAFALLRSSRPGRLVILGEGPEREHLMTLARDLDVARDVLLPGFVANPFAWLGRASLFVLSSAWEGLPTVLIEALACGTPVVATDCPHGPREILEDLGPCVPVGDANAMEEAMRLMLAAPTERRLLLDRAVAFCPDRVAATYREILTEGA
jgi:glycosyltransferase involved in cell wall biosynthesis